MNDIIEKLDLITQLSTNEKLNRGATLVFFYPSILAVLTWAEGGRGERVYEGKNPSDKRKYFSI